MPFHNTNPNFVYGIKYAPMGNSSTGIYQAVGIFFSKYKLITTIGKVLTKEEEKIYTNGTVSLTSTIEYLHNSPLHMKVTTLHRTNSNGIRISEKYKYVYDYYYSYEDDRFLITYEPTSTVLLNNVGTNCLYQNYANSLIEKTSYRENNGKFYIINSLLNLYKYQNNKPLLYEIYEIKNSILNSSYDFEDLSGTSARGLFFKNNLYEKICSFDFYNSKGNLLQYTGKEKVPISYIWSYNYQYPIAEIKNATFAMVESAAKSVFSVSSIDALSALTTPNEAKLKDGSLQKALPNALVTTYTYKPLVGMLTATDPSGSTIHYEYDVFGRLQRTKDVDGKTVQNYDYNYVNK